MIETAGRNQFNFGDQQRLATEALSREADAINAILRQHGLTLAQLNAAAEQAGVTLLDSHGRLIPDAADQAAEALLRAQRAGLIFGDTLD